MFVQNKTMLRLMISIVTAILLFSPACSKKEADVLVRVDGSKLTLAEFKNYIPESEYRKLPDATIKSIFDNWVNQEVLYLEAKKKGLDKGDSVQLLIAQYVKNMLAMALVREEFGSTTVSDLEILNYFNEHQNEFLYAVKFAEIVLSGYETAVTTLAEIKSGADFIKIAKERSLTRMENPEDPRVVTDYMPRGRLGDFGTEEIIFKLNPGEVSDVIPYLQGTFLIVKMIDRKKILSKAELTDDLKSQIYNHLLSRKYQEFLMNLVDSLKTKYKITTDLEPLKK